MIRDEQVETAVAFTVDRSHKVYRRRGAVQKCGDQMATRQQISSRSLGIPKIRHGREAAIAMQS